MANDSTELAQSVDPNRLELTNETGTAGVLRGHRCTSCNISVFGLATFCQSCTSSDLEAIRLDEHGTLYSYTVVRVPPREWPGNVPYTLGEVELPEGPHVLAEVIGCESSDLKIGMRMDLAIELVSIQENNKLMSVYKWKPSSSQII